MIGASRYYRSLRIWWPFNLLPFFGAKPFSLIDHEYVKGFLDEGCAVVVFDVRGGGASFGTQQYPWWPREREDIDELIEWLKTQPYSNGKFGLWGISYGAVLSVHASLRQAYNQKAKTADARQVTF